MTTIKNAYKITSRYIFQSIRNMGFTIKSCIFELIDNSIDDESDNIDITFKKNAFGYNELTIEDDGTGVPEDKVGDYFTTLGMDEKYAYTALAKVPGSIEADQLFSRVFNDFQSPAAVEKLQAALDSESETELFDGSTVAYMGPVYAFTSSIDFNEGETPN